MLIKKFFIWIFLIPTLVFGAHAAFSEPLSARSFVLINAETNEIIASHNHNLKLSMASTTKIMTSLIAIESGKMNCAVTSEKDINIEGTAIGIKKGDCFSLETLVYAMMLESGNDAAVLTAEYLAETEDSFSELMNKKADRIGMTSTNFETSSGLDSDEHYTTAYDMALLTSYAVKNPVFKKICSAKIHSARQIKPEVKLTFSNHNKLLNSYDGVFGVKTGFTRKSGRCLVSACERNGITLIAVTLNAPDDWNDHTKLYDYGFAQVKSKEIKAEIPDKIKVYGSDKNEITLKCTYVGLSAFADDKTDVRIRLKKFLYAPIEKNQIVGFVDIYNDGVCVKSVGIYARESAELGCSSSKPNFDFIYKFKQLFKS